MREKEKIKDEGQIRKEERINDVKNELKKRNKNIKHKRRKMNDSTVKEMKARRFDAFSTVSSRRII